MQKTYLVSCAPLPRVLPPPGHTSHVSSFCAYRRLMRQHRGRMEPDLLDLMLRLAAVELQHLGQVLGLRSPVCKTETTLSTHSVGEGGRSGK